MHLHSTSNKTVLHGLVLKSENTVCKKNRYSLQGMAMSVVCKMKVCMMIICKMTVYKKNA